MKKITLFVAILLSLTASHSFGQANAPQSPYVTLKGLRTPQVINGEQQPVYTTSDFIRRNPVLTANVPNTYEVTEFTVSIKGGGKTFGPYSVKGAALSQQILDKIRETKGPAVLVSIENIKAKTANGAVTMLAPITMKYDQ